MLHPLIYLSALSLLAGAQGLQIFHVSSQLNISSCPITFYGQTYNQIYVNFTNDAFAICLNGFYDPQSRGDCIVGPPLLKDSGIFQIVPSNTLDEAFVNQHLPSIKTKLQCIPVVDVYHSNIAARFVLLNHGTQSALYFYSSMQESLVYDVQVDGNTVDKLNITQPSQQYWTIIDSSGCRHSGVLYRPGTVVNSPETCLNLTCNQTAALSFNECGPLEHCKGNGVCTLESTTTCTLTGPTVIDFNGQVNSVQDRCVHSLMSTPSLPDFLILGNFQERSRKDVSFLDSVTLRLNGSGVLIHLEQGGRVRLDDTTLTLNSSTQLVHSVELSKDQTGVIAKVSLSNYTTSVFFDGYTAQISLTGPGLPSQLSGLCANSISSSSELRFSNYSSSGCEMQYSDTADSTINCTWATEFCELMSEEPFTACIIHTSPQPYVTACTNTLCKYPAVDGLSCQFLKAYSRACNLQNNETVGDWWTKAGCSHPQAFCQDRTCSPHEFCGQKMDSGETRCFCRALFASEYTSTNTLGGPTVCSQDSASLSLVGCLLEDKGIDYSTLHLNDQTCRGHMDQQTHMVTFSFNNSNTCGAVVTTNNSQIIYKNAITNQNSSDIIQRHDQVYIDFSCVETQPDIKTMSFSIKDSSVIQHITSGAWSYSLTMNVYNDAERTQAVDPSTAVQLDQRIWVELKTDGLDDSLVVVVTDSCWATSEPSPNGSLRYDLIINGCANPTDQTVKVEGNGLGTSNYFTFNMFQFTGKSGDIYLHCKLQLCVKENNDCVPVCNGVVRGRRSVRPKYQDEALAFISMAWTN
ncbi:alpha-tectorin-like isoform X2 [Channa argus]|uniref:alpha-tectorin-like isoform X2 n=1 Tax=Channa argus TaxID=215402 RepID=UPI003522FDBD